MAQRKYSEGEVDDGQGLLQRSQSSDTVNASNSTRVSWCTKSCLVSCWIGSGVTATVLILLLVIRLNLCWTSEGDCGLLRLVSPQMNASPVPLVHAHSHNDYEQSRPLSLALEAGYCSIEADVYDVNGKLMLGHLTAGPLSLKETYLDPLKRRIDLNDGFVYKRSKGLGLCEQVTLLVDLKTNQPENLWDILESELRQVFPQSESDGTMQKYIQCGGNGVTSAKTVAPLRVVVSGVESSDAPRFAHHVVQQEQGYCSYLDGRPTTQLNDEITAIQTQTSTSYGSISTGNQVNQNALKTLTLAAHARGELVRIWGAPVDAKVWGDLLSGGVDIVSTDQVLLLRNFLLF